MLINCVEAAERLSPGSVAPGILAACTSARAVIGKQQSAQPTEEVRRLREQVDLDTLEKLLSKATPGPWRVDDLYTGGGSLTNQREAFCGGERWPVATVCASDDGILLPVAHCPGVPEGGPLQTLPTPGRDAANAALISALKAAAPALIAIARAALKEGSQ